MKLRVSVTELDSLAYWMASDFTLDELLARLRRDGPVTDAMLRGRAFHTVLENAGEGELSTVEQDGYTFRFDVEGEFALPRIREVKGEKVYRIGDVEVTLVGIVDALCGLTIHDHKLTKQFDPENYTDAIQWRAYLDMFGAKCFQYNVFEGAEDRTGAVAIRHFHPMTFYTYPELTDDVTKALEGFVDVIRNYLPERLEAA